MENGFTSPHNCFNNDKGPPVKTYLSNRTAGTAVVVFLSTMLAGLHPQTVTKRAIAAQACDCSCEVFTGFKSRMQELSEAAQSGGTAVMTPELQQAAACVAQCAAQWAQCGREATAGVNKGSEPEGDDTAAASPDGAQTEPSVGDSGAGAQADAGFYLGAPRDDLERFYGVYGDGGGSGRSFFVTAAKYSKLAEKTMPPGYLMIGAMWGDVAPWYMKAVSETRFEQQRPGPSAEPVIAEFEVDAAGNARAVVFETVFDDRGRLERVGDLPEGW